MLPARCALAGASDRSLGLRHDCVACAPAALRIRPTRRGENCRFADRPAAAAYRRGCSPCGAPGPGRPALIVWSEDDAFFPLEDGRRLATALPNSQLEVIGQARTFSMIDRPDQLADLIADFAHASAIRRAA
jgi:pimeloyl-ACP methyl ester carboxylesterase